jgi:hypothetical protein
MSDQVLVIGSLVLIGACVAIVALATKIFRESQALADAVITSEPGAPFELVCGIRLGVWNATWPFGRFRLTEDGVAFTSLGLPVRVAWAEVKVVELLKPFNLIGWGVRFRIHTRSDVIVWVMSRAIAERIIEACEVHLIPSRRKPRLAL